MRTRAMSSRSSSDELKAETDKALERARRKAARLLKGA